MFLAWRSACRAAGALLFSSNLLLLLAQDPPPAARPENAVRAAKTACLPLSARGVPLRSTIQARVNGLVQASRSKAGRKLWVNAVYPMEYRFCQFEAGASIYGEITAASASRVAGKSELGLNFDGIDCMGQSKRPVKLYLIGAIAPPDKPVESGHEALPSEVHGAREISELAMGTDGWDPRLNPGGPPNTIRPGIVLGFKHFTLEPQGGPQCSARISSTEGNIELGPGTILLLAPSAAN